MKLIYIWFGFIMILPIVQFLLIKDLDFLNTTAGFYYVLLAVLALILSFFFPSFGIFALILTISWDFFSTPNSSFSISLNDFIFFPILSGFILNSFYFKKKFPFKKSPIDIYLLIFLLILIISFFQSFFIPNEIPVYGNMVYNMPFARSLTRIFVLMHSVLFFYLIFWFIDSEKKLKKVLSWLFTSVFLVCLIGLLGWTLNYINIPFFKNLLVTESLKTARINSFFAEPINLGMLIMTVLPIAILLFVWLKEKQSLKHVVLLICLSITLYLTFSRAAWLGLITTFIIFVTLEKYFNVHQEIKTYGVHRRKILSAFFILLIFTLFFINIGIFKKGINPADAFNFWSTKSRLILLYSAFDLFLTNPIFGIGYDNFAFYFFKSLPEIGVMDLVNLTEPNNLLIKILAELGLFGFVISLLLVGSFMFCLIRHIRNTFDPFYKAVLAGGFLSLVSLFVQYQFISKIAFPYVWVFIGILISTMPLSEKEECLKKYSATKQPK